MVFYSSEMREPTYADLGVAEAWSRSACRAYSDMFAAQGWDATYLTFPEAYPSASFLPTDAGGHTPEGARPAHLSFRPIEKFNLVKGARNIFAFPWRYPVISEHFTWDTSIQKNMRHMLGLADEVWASSRYAADTLTRAGVANVHAMPAPAPVVEPARDLSRALEGFSLRFDGFTGAPADKLKLGEFVAQFEDEPPVLFVSVVDPDDPCGNIEALIRGFMVATMGASNAALVVVLALDTQRRGELRAPDIGYKLAERAVRADADLVSDRVLLVPDRLSVARMAALFQKADFYLCASAAEDQNLPLQMAMARRAVPVSTRVTAMADYLDDDNSIAVATTPGALSAGALAVSAASPTFSADLATPRSVADAVRRALALTEAERSNLADAGEFLIETEYSQDAIARQAAERLAADAAPLSEAWRAPNPVFAGEAAPWGELDCAKARAAQPAAAPADEDDAETITVLTPAETVGS